MKQYQHQLRHPHPLSSQLSSLLFLLWEGQILLVHLLLWHYLDADVDVMLLNVRDPQVFLLASCESLDRKSRVQNLQHYKLVLMLPLIPFLKFCKWLWQHYEGHRQVELRRLHPLHNQEAQPIHYSSKPILESILDHLLKLCKWLWKNCGGHQLEVLDRFNLLRNLEVRPIQLLHQNLSRLQ